MQRCSGDVLHHQEQVVTVFANLENLADVGVVERRDGHRLATEPFARFACRLPSPPAGA